MSKQPSLTSLASASRPAGLRRLDDAVASAISDTDLEGIVKTFKDKALAGHVGSANFLLKLLGADSGPTNVVVNQFYSDAPVNSEKPASVVEIGMERIADRSPLERISIMLSVAGKSSPAAIAEATFLDVTAVINTLDAHPTRFSVEGNTYDLARH